MLSSIALNRTRRVEIANLGCAYGEKVSEISVLRHACFYVLPAPSFRRDNAKSEPQFSLPAPMSKPWSRGSSPIAVSGAMRSTHFATAAHKMQRTLPQRLDTTNCRHD